MALRGESDILKAYFTAVGRNLFAAETSSQQSADKQHSAERREILPTLRLLVRVCVSACVCVCVCVCVSVCECVCV